MNAFTSITRAETPAMHVVRAWFADLTPAQAMQVLGWLLDTGRDDPDPIGDTPLVDALLPVREAYLAAYRNIEREIEG